jgi:hypothetical protein
LSYLERISCVGNDVDEPHLASDHVVQSPTINPVNIATNKPITSVFNPTFHNVGSPTHNPKTIPNIGPYQIQSIKQNLLPKFSFISPLMEKLTLKQLIFYKKVLFFLFFLNKNSYTGLSSNKPSRAIIDASIVKIRKSNENNACPRITFTTCKTVKRARILRRKSLFFVLDRSFNCLSFFING